jgi:IS30 family transposase
MCSKACVEAHRVVISSRTIKKLHADPTFRENLNAINSERMKGMWRDDEFRATSSQASSDRMRARRNGGDPELNATLAKACGAHLKRMWEKQSFRDMHRELGTAKLAAYNASDERQLQDAELRKVMGQAARKLRTDPAFSEIMSRKSIEHRLADPYDPARHGDYNPDYVSYICTRVQEDEEMRTFHDTRMAALLKEAWEQWWEDRAA